MKRKLRVWLKVLVTGAFATITGCQFVAGLGELEVICPVNDPSCMFCTTDDDCPASDPCRSWTCIKYRCTPTDAPAGVSCPAGVCSGEVPSTCVDCVVDADCGEGAYCTQKHHCGRCDDGIKNGDEAEVDCGGDHCLQCLGLPCSTGDECISGFCADGGCCNASCTDVCLRCNLKGNCEYLPYGGTDLSPVCVGHTVCNGGGYCGLREGEPCMSAADCASFNCADGTCGPP